MSDSEEPPPDSDRELGDIFVTVTGETTIENQQEEDEETSKKVIEDADSASSQEKPSDADD